MTFINSRSHSSQLICIKPWVKWRSSQPANLASHTRRMLTSSSSTSTYPQWSSMFYTPYGLVLSGFTNGLKIFLLQLLKKSLKNAKPSAKYAAYIEFMCIMEIAKENKEISAYVRVVESQTHHPQNFTPYEFMSMYYDTVWCKIFVTPAVKQLWISRRPQLKSMASKSAKGRSENFTSPI